MGKGMIGIRRVVAAYSLIVLIVVFVGIQSFQPLPDEK